MSHGVSLPRGNVSLVVLSLVHMHLTNGIWKIQCEQVLHAIRYNSDWTVFNSLIEKGLG